MRIKTIIFFIILNFNIVNAENVSVDLNKVLKNLRCLICQGQSVADSNSEFAQTIKIVVRDQINDGKSEKDHDHDHDKDHDDHGDEVHSEFQASYLWNCHHADDLDSVQTRMMKVFPRIEEIRVQWIVGDRQGAMELENQDGKIRGWR